MEGIINVLKPPGMTSGDVVHDIRRICGMKRVGHMGTLDPGAAGVLPVCIGRATRLFDLLVDKEKRYIAELRFGIATDTQDSYGTQTGLSKKIVTRDALASVLHEFTGQIEQTAPLYSAVRHNGERLYKLARAGGGEEIRPKARTVTVAQLSILEEMGENRFLMDIKCSKGTYVRALCSDIGLRLSSLAHVSFLLRTASGMFSLEDSYSLDELKDMKERGVLREAVIPVEAALLHLDELRLLLTEREVFHLKNGVRIPVEGRNVYGHVRLYANDAFLGIGAVDDGGVKIALPFFEVENG